MTMLCINLQLCFRLWFLFDTFKSISYIIKPLLHYTNNSNHNFCSVCNNTPSAWLFFSRMLIRWPLFYGLIFESLNLMITIVLQYQCFKHGCYVYKLGLISNVLGVVCSILSSAVTAGFHAVRNDKTVLFTLFTFGRM